MPFTAWEQEEKKQTQRQKNLFTTISRDFMIIVTNNSLIDNK